MFGVSIIPKWLIKVPGHIPYFLDHFWNIKKSTKYVPSDPVFTTKTLQRFQEKSKQHNSLELLNLFFKHIFHKIDPNMADEFPIILLWFSYYFSWPDTLQTMVAWGAFPKVPLTTARVLGTTFRIAVAIGNPPQLYQALHNLELYDFSRLYMGPKNGV